MSATCSSCGQPINVHERVRGGTCNTIQCRAKAVKHHKAQADVERRSREIAVAAAHLGSMLGPQRTSDGVTLVVLTGSNATLQPPSAARRENLRNNVAASILNSEQSDVDAVRREPPTAAFPPSFAALAAGCATCRGYCCREGGDSAYLDASTLRRIRAERPALSSAELLELYVAMIPEHSVANSCIFHGEQGCALPRELRSHTCNDFFCAPMCDWIAREVSQPAAVIIVQDAQVLRSALID
jgi:hypothetical protein